MSFLHVLIFRLRRVRSYADHKTSSVLAHRHIDRAKASARKKQKLLDAAAGSPSTAATSAPVPASAPVVPEETIEERQAREDEEAALNGDVKLEVEKEDGDEFGAVDEFAVPLSSAPERMEVDSLLSGEDGVN